MLPSSRRVALGLLVAVLGLNVAAFGVRLWFVATTGSLAATTGFEEFCLYNIWKVRHALPLYEWPQREPYLLTSYNGAFYHAYAAWARLWGADGAGLAGCVRLLTPLWALAGMAITVHLLRRLAPEARGTKVWLWGLPFLAWFGTGFNAWTTVTARPDIAAATLAMGGLALALRAEVSRRAPVWLAASLCFFAAWGFKQSVVWIFAGVALFLVTERRWREWAAHVLPFAVLVALVLAASSEAYRYNLFVVPGIYRWIPRQSVPLLAQAVALNLFFWGLGAVALRAAFARRDAAAAQEPGIVARRMVAIAAIPAVAMGTMQLALHGSSTNNLLEGFLMVALLGSAEWLRHLSQPGWRLVPAGAVLLATMIPLPVLQLAMTMRGVPYAEIHGVSCGNLIKLNPAQVIERAQFASYLATLPKPLWLRDAMLQLPWYADDNRYPAYLLDFQFQADAVQKGRLVGAGIPGLIRDRYFACLILRANDGLIWLARKAGYHEAPLPLELRKVPTEYGLVKADLVLLARDSSEPWHPAKPELRGLER